MAIASFIAIPSTNCVAVKSAESTGRRKTPCISKNPLHYDTANISRTFDECGFLTAQDLAENIEKTSQ